MSYQRNRTNPTRFRTLTGLGVDHFDALLPYFHDEHDEYFRYHQLDGSPRKGIRPPCIYSNSPLPGVADRLYFILYYLKNNPLQETMADHFNMTVADCNRWIHLLYRLLRKAVTEAAVSPASTERDLRALYERMDSEELTILLHDGTEREIPRPSDADEQCDKYSGKKKRHTVKNGIITTFLGAILFVSPTVSGRVHDRRIADGYFFPDHSLVMQDTGYAGYRGNWKTVMPFKKPRGGSLDQMQKSHNRFISSHRIRVEHCIGSSKILRIAKDECRVRKEGFVDSVFHVSSAIHNLRMGVKLPLKFKINV